MEYNSITAIDIGTTKIASIVNNIVPFKRDVDSTVLEDFKDILI